MASSRLALSLLTLVIALTLPVACGPKFTLATNGDGADSSVVLTPDASGAGDSDVGADGGSLPGECQPTVKCGDVVECGSVSDGCDNVLQCGACPLGSRCQLGHCATQVFCGNGTCEQGEDCASCAPDCKCPGGTCSAGQCCAPSCAGKQCGDDGCGGVCGECGARFQCTAGACAPMVSCGNGTCEPALLENCSTCARDCACATGACRSGACCQPSCAGKSCGDDGCGGTCAPGCGAGATCDSGSGQCREQIVCGDPQNPRLPGKCQSGESCLSCPLDCGCSDPNARCTPGGACCVPNCAGLSCGSDGCGGKCGVGPREDGCPSNTTCLGGKCVGCGNGICEAGESCANCADCSCDAARGQVCAKDTGACCTPQCSGKSCGPDGCGGQCGSCSMGQACDANGACVVLSTCGDGVCAAGEDCRSCPKDCGACCTPQCTGLSCGPDGCGGSCGTCASGTACARGVCAPVCGDGVCATAAGENCGTCPGDCLCARGATCYNNACCRVPTCGTDWQCGAATVCGMLVACPKCAYGTCVNHVCDNGCLSSTMSSAIICPVTTAERIAP